MHIKKISFFVFIIFLISFFWGLFFTYGFNFFWEDFDYFKLDKEVSSNSGQNVPVSVSFNKLWYSYSKEAFDPHRLFQIGFAAAPADRPAQYLTYDLLNTFFGDKVILHRLFRSLIFAIIAAMIFMQISKVSLAFAFLGTFLYLTSSEFWLGLFYATNAGLYAIFAVFLSIVLFIKIIEEFPKAKWRALSYYLPIFILSNYANLINGEGRYLAIIFILTLLLFRRNQFFYHLPALSVILLFQVPVLGFIKKIFIRQDFAPINLASHNPVPFFDSVKIIAANIKFPVVAAGKITVGLLFLLVLINIFYLLNQKTKLKDGSVSTRFSFALINERLFIFMMWFFATLTMVAFARNLAYDGFASLQLADLFYIVVPFCLFFIYYIFKVGIYFNGQFRKKYLLACSLLILAQIALINLPRLNQLRGGWGNYYCAWQNAEKYVDGISNNALVFTIDRWHSKVVVFHNSNNKVIHNSDIFLKYPSLDLQYVEEEFIGKGYSDLFLIKEGEINFKGSAKKIKLVSITKLSGDSGDLYDRLKRLIRRPSKPLVYVYHFKNV